MKTKRINRREAIGAMGAAAGAALGFGLQQFGRPARRQHRPRDDDRIDQCRLRRHADGNDRTVSVADESSSAATSAKASPAPTLTLTIKVVNVNAACAAVSGANVEIWQCDATGNYSEYGSQTTQTYLRGIQTTNSNGEVTFTTIYPGWYQGRATHIHIEVKTGGVSRKATQIAFPESVNNTVYASGVYASRGSNPMSNLSDGIFADSLSAELVTPTGSPASGYTASCQVAISV